MPTLLRTVIPALALSSMIAISAAADPIPLIDAHSQVDHKVELGGIVPLMDEAGIAHVILATRSRLKPGPFMRFAREYPTRITPSVRTKSRWFNRNHDKFYRRFRKQLAMPRFVAMAEVIIWHAQKGNKAEFRAVSLESPQVQAALQAAKARGWPFVVHIEFAAAAAAGNYDTYMASFKRLLDAHPEHPFPLIHMGQLSATETRELIAAHQNVYFITSHANPVRVSRSRQPWVDMFDGGEVLAPVWKRLVIAHPERFILGFDNVWEEDWSDLYGRQADLWRSALADLPHGVAHKVAHRNAERLWRLKPARYVEPG